MGQIDWNRLHQESQAMGLDLPQDLRPDVINRFPAAGKKHGNKSAYCKIFDSGVVLLGDWTTGESVIVPPEGKVGYSMTAQQKTEIKAAIAAERKRTELERKKLADQARKKANDVYSTAPVAPATHPYLIKKGIGPIGETIRLNHYGQLVVPIIDQQGEISSLQLVGEDGSKLFLKNGAIKGGFYPVQVTNNKQITLCEGLATGLTLASVYVPSHTVLVCFNAGNLEEVAKHIREKYPQALITIAADNDRYTYENVGLKKAENAAVIARGQVSMPKFKDHERGSDWNDRALLDGLLPIKGGE